MPSHAQPRDAAIDPPTAASFNCGKAQSDVERMICNDPQLRHLDRALAQAYVNGPRTRDTAPDERALGQRQWLNNVRNRCSSVACLKSVYQDRIDALDDDAASFDCARAHTDIEHLICSDPGLKYDDRSLDQTYRALIKTGVDAQRNAAEQATWLAKVRNRCTVKECLQGAMATRADALEHQRDAAVALLAKAAGYTKTYTLYDVAPWPHRAELTIAAFALPLSSPQTEGYAAGEVVGFDLDIYVFETGSRKVLHHVNGGLDSDAIALNSLAIDATDYNRALGVPAFGLLSTHSHNGCAGYDSHSLRLYALIGQPPELKQILDDVARHASRGMCQSECNGVETWRRIAFPESTQQPLPPLTLYERVDGDDEAGTSTDGHQVCSSAAARHVYPMIFDHGQYQFPKGVDVSY